MKKIIKILIAIPILFSHITSLHPMKPKKLETQIKKALREENITKAENLIAKLRKFKEYKHLADSYEIQLLKLKQSETGDLLKKCKKEKKELEERLREAEGFVGAYKRANEICKAELIECKTKTTKDYIEEIKQLKSALQNCRHSRQVYREEKKLLEDDLKNKNNKITELENKLDKEKRNAQSWKSKYNECQKKLDWCYGNCACPPIPAI